jgi:peptidoglycan/LPS O-acetylase OafA/YrhL
VDAEHPAPFRRLVHVPALDVLRAFAVSIVVMSHIWEVAPYFHFREIFSNAGFLGVDLFFVISGFLITALLLQERHDSGRISFGRFYLRRAIRLLPALFVMLAVYLVYAHGAGWSLFGGRDSVVASVRATLLYAMNWQVLWHPFAVGDLVALWSLAIEEQFYLVWPLLLAGFLAVRRSTRHLIPVLLGAVVVVTLWRVAVYQWWGWQSAYLRTDTRVDGLLLGALVATLFVRGMTPARLPRWTPWAVLAVWSALMLSVKGDGAFAYHGGITLWIIASAAMVLYLVSDPQPLRSLPARAAEKVGKGSYAIYLWQVPVIRVVGRMDDKEASVRRITLSLIGIAICTVLSWYLVERPAQRFRRRLEHRPPASGDEPPTADASVAPAD